MVSSGYEEVINHVVGAKVGSLNALATAVLLAVVIALGALDVSAAS
ncbi:unannotated protein [freshwater metagenome]|uniref:Unannotated protein n=1 Tax=freshwater metagenome TaxID=449393 RepID=A0A6J6HTP3_9ZZZZ